MGGSPQSDSVLRLWSPKPAERLAFLEPLGELRVPFEAGRGGEGPLTLGQANVIQWVQDKVMYRRMTEWVFDLPAGISLDDIAAAWQVLMVRHESLRTTFVSEDSRPLQRVARSGELRIVVLAAPSELTGLTGEVVRYLRAAEFDLAHELPVRVGVVMSDGAPIMAVAVYSHMATDFEGSAVLAQQFGELVRDRKSRVPGPPGHQPLDQAAYEQSPPGRRRTAAALQRWTSCLWQLPQSFYAVPPAPAGTGVPAGSRARAAYLWSPGAARALSRIAERTGSSRHMVVLAAVCAVLAHRLGYRRCVLPMLSSNRFERHLRDYVGTLVNDTLISVDVMAADFDELVRRVGTETLRASRDALVNRTGMLRTIAQVDYERGTAFARDCAFSDLSRGDSFAKLLQASAVDPSVADRADRSVIWWVDWADIPELLQCSLLRIEKEMVLGMATSDVRRVPQHEIESLLGGMESLIIAAADKTIGLERISEITGIAPMPRGEEWLMVNSCWIQLPEVQRLAEDALGEEDVRVFAVPDRAGAPALVAYLVARERIRTPEQAHAAVMTLLQGRTGREMGLLPNRPTAIAPGCYVICADAPDDPADLASWLRQQVVAAGPGRSRSNPAKDWR